MDKQEAKKILDALSSQELVDLGYVKLDKYNEVTANFVNTFSDLITILTSWASNVNVEAQKSRNSNVIIFAKHHLANLKDLVGQKMAQLHPDETHRDS